MQARRAFNMIELVVVVAILGVIGAIAAPRLTSSADAAAMRAQHQAFLAIERALEMYHADHGAWPENTHARETPEPLLPYLRGTPFGRKPPIADVWDWNGPGSGVYDHGNNIGVRKLGGDPRPLYREFDEMFDDGDLRTGLYRRDGNWLVRVVTEP